MNSLVINQCFINVLIFGIYFVSIFALKFKTYIPLYSNMYLIKKNKIIYL